MTLDRYMLVFDAHHLGHHSFLLGNRGGFVLYLPAATNVRDGTRFPIKWFGASGFGRKFLEGIVTSVELEGKTVLLDRPTESSLTVKLDEVIRTHRVGDEEIRERYFVPDGMQALVYTLETGLSFVIRPEFDMRYYQAFNSDFSCYVAEDTTEGLLVSNRVENVGALHDDLEFYCSVATEGEARVEMRALDRRLIAKTYLKDEMRNKFIRSTYEETGSTSPDEAPIWDEYGTCVYSPAEIHGKGPITLFLTFGDTHEEVQTCLAALRKDLPHCRVEKRETIEQQIDRAALTTGDTDADTAYVHLLTRLNDTLVARDVTLHVSPAHREHFYGIFAGNKYFMDAWKRDENISLGALLATNDFETVRAILDNTWTHQDPRTGRLPHIIRAGEPFVYYSSDGTLWALHRLGQYTRESGDETLLHEKMEMVRSFFAASMPFVRRGLLPSGGIIEPDYLWETWMDTPYTPRAGYPVEIELLWLTVLSEFLSVVRAVDKKLATSMSAALDEGRKTFELFTHDGYLCDSLSYDWQPDTVLTPNGYMAFELGYPLPPDLGRSMVLLARDQLAGLRGIRSLAPRDWPRVFPPAFLDDPRTHDGKNMASVGIYNYHRGIEWEWLNHFLIAGELQFGSTDAAYHTYLEKEIGEALDEGGIGGLSELYDLHGELGADFQAWSMAGALKSFHLFAGIEVDAIERTIRICPSLPHEWSHLRCRRRAGNSRFDMRFDGGEDGQRSLQLRMVDPVPPDYTIQAGIRIPSGAHIRSAQWNGRDVPSGEWKDSSHSTPRDTTLWLTRPLEGEIRLSLVLDVSSLL